MVGVPAIVVVNIDIAIHRFTRTVDGFSNQTERTSNPTVHFGLRILHNTLGDYQRLISKDSSYILWYDKDSVSVRVEHMPSGSWWRGLLKDSGTRVPMTTEAWYHLIGTFDGTAIRLYTNGVEVSRSNPISAFPSTNDNPVFFGRSWDANWGSFMNGIMDEILIEGTARSADWLRLCYTNQRVDDTLVVFKLLLKTYAGQTPFSFYRNPQELYLYFSTNVKDMLYYLLYILRVV